uniref:Uncharacterized protein n=1 Tax=Arundo donax TaxID=35708 RepID=A0A0A9A1P5_ARUDO
MCLVIQSALFCSLFLDSLSAQFQMDE